MSLSANALPDPVSDSTEHSVDLCALQRELSSRYELAFEEVALGDNVVAMLKVADTNRLLEQIDAAAFSEDERFPFWAELWPSSVELGRFCLQDGGLQGAAVLELGSGLGLAGIAATLAGADVIFSDYEPNALLFARHNALYNLPHDAYTRSEFRLFDWRSIITPLRVDMILGADVVYEKRNFLPILNTVRRHLKGNGRAIFTDPDRTTGMSFFALAENEGFDVSVESRLLCVGGKEKTIVLGELRCRQ